MQDMAKFLFDVGFAICYHLAIRDICALQATCKTLYSLLQERPIWYVALRDVLSVKPLPSLQQDMLHMPSDDIHAACLGVAKIDKAFSRTELFPMLAFNVEGHDYSGIHLLPGGTRCIATNHTGELHLCAFDSQSSDRVTISAPLPVPGNSQLRVLITGAQDVLILHAIQWFSGDCNLEFRIYRVQENIQLLATIRPEDPKSMVYYDLNETAYGPALVYLQGNSGRELLARVCLIDHDTSVLRPAAALRLRGWVAPSYLHNLVLLYGSLAFFGSDRLLLATSCGIYLYKVPPLESIVTNWDKSGDAGVIEVFPTWSTCGAWATSTPLLSPAVLYGGARARARCAIWTGHDVHILDVPLHEEPCNFIQYWTARINKEYTYQTLQSVSHGFGIYRHRSKDALSSMVSLTVKNGDERGYVRLGHEPDAFRQVSLTWEDKSCLMDISMDELSGRIAVLDWASGESSKKRLRIYDVVQ